MSINPEEWGIRRSTPFDLSETGRDRYVGVRRRPDTGLHRASRDWEPAHRRPAQLAMPSGAAVAAASTALSAVVMFPSAPVHETPPAPPGYAVAGPSPGRPMRSDAGTGMARAPQRRPSNPAAGPYVDVPPPPFVNMPEPRPRARPGPPAAATGRPHPPAPPAHRDTEPPRYPDPGRRGQGAQRRDHHEDAGRQRNRPDDRRATPGPGRQDRRSPSPNPGPDEHQNAPGSSRGPHRAGRSDPRDRREPEDRECGERPERSGRELPPHWRWHYQRNGAESRRAPTGEEAQSADRPAGWQPRHRHLRGSRRHPAGDAPPSGARHG